MISACFWNQKPGILSRDVSMNSNTFTFDAGLNGKAKVTVKTESASMEGFEQQDDARYL